MSNFHYSQTPPDETTSRNLARLNAFSVEQLTSLVSIMFDFLQSKHSADSLLTLVDSWSTQQSVNNAVVREIVRCSLSVFRTAIRGNLSPTYLLADLKQFGLADEKATLIAQMWKSSLANIKRTAVGNTLTVNQLVDLEWKFGVTAANTDLSKVGDCFLQFKLSLDDGDSRIRRVPMELTLPQFYSLFSELEKARAQISL